MLTFAFDAGGDAKTEMLTVAGFASSAKDWDSFSKEWKRRLDQDGIEFSHAVGLAHFRGPFERWRDKPEQEREALRRNLCADLMCILKSHVYRRFGCTIINKDFGDMSAELREEFSLCAYSVAGRTCEKDVRMWLLQDPDWRGPLLRGNLSVELVFEAGDHGYGRLQKRLAADSSIPPIFRPKKNTTLDGGIVQPGYVPLQAADWLAYELNLATQRFSGGKLESESQLRWAMQEFIRYPPGYLGLYTPKDLKEMEAGIELQKKIVEWEVAIGLSK